MFAIGEEELDIRRLIMKILVTGANGQLGYDVCQALTARKVEHKGVGRADFTITDKEKTHDYITNYHPDVVIHCAAWTDVDKAEDENKKAYAVNTEGTQNIAAACKTIDAKMLYISTDYVFPGDGERFYKPDDPTGPLGVYGKTKLGGELAVKALLNHFFIVRISWVFGKNGNNFVKKMLNLAKTKEKINVVCDQIGSPTYTADLAPLLCDMAETDRYGVYHAANEGVCSWAEFAREIFRLAGEKTKVNPVLTSEYPGKAARPLNSRMNKDKLEEMGFSRLPDWHDALRRYMQFSGWQ